MLRRSLALSAVHRTLSGVTLSDPAVSALLDAELQRRHLPAPADKAQAVYWITREIADQNNLAIATNAMPVKVDLGKKWAESIAPQSRLPQTSKKAAAAGGPSTSRGVVELFPLSATSNPARWPEHNVGGRAVPRPLQVSMEQWSILHNFRSTTWYTVNEIEILRAKIRDGAKPLQQLKLKPRSSSGGGGSNRNKAVGDAPPTTALYYNADDVVLPPAPAAASVDAVVRETVAGSGHGSNRSGEGRVRHVEGDGSVAPVVYRTGLNRAFPLVVQQQLAEIARARGFCSSRFYTPSQMFTNGLRPKGSQAHGITGELVARLAVEVVTADGNLLVLMNEDDLESGTASNARSLASLLSKFFRPRFISEQQARLGRGADVLFDGCARVIWQPDIKAAVLRDYLVRKTAMHLQACQEEADRINAEAAASKPKKGAAESSKALVTAKDVKLRRAPPEPSRQYMTLWEISSLGMETLPDAQRLELHSGDFVTVLYNGSDIVPQQRIPPSEDFECEQHLLEPQEQPLPEPKGAKQ